jgi:hypothetical protein
MENNEINKEVVVKPKLNIPSAIVLSGVIIAAAIFLRDAQVASSGSYEDNDKLAKNVFGKLLNNIQTIKKLFQQKFWLQTKVV